MKYEYAGGFRRFFAMLLDTIFLSLIMGIIGFGAVFGMGKLFIASGNMLLMLIVPIVLYVILFLIPLLWFVKGDSNTRGGTLGKRIMKCKVLSMRNGSRITFGQSFKRYFYLMFLPSLPGSIAYGCLYLPMSIFMGETPLFIKIEPFVLYGTVGFAVIGWIASFIGVFMESKKFRTWWDRASKTVVVVEINQ